MSNSLFNIQKQYVDLIGVLLENGGEITPELETSLQINKEEFQVKSENYAAVIRQLDGECSIIDTEIERLNKLRDTRSKAIERLKNNISHAMNLYEIEKIETPLLKLSFRKSESVEISDIKLLDRKFIVVKTSEQADKTAIKNAIKAGELVVGAIIKQNKSLQIK
jgi:hypothetical protein